ncbi:MAG: hypothetical protein N3C59_09130 [Azovibrio sp.]|nr:hypothetical protein [Azovibrio sp.]
MANGPYQNLAIIIAAIRRQAEAGAWEDAAKLAAQLGQHIGAAPPLPAATAADRNALEAALADIAAITERAGPLQEDIGRLLAAFGSPANPG